jgi:hypothetical protein
MTESPWTSDDPQPGDLDALLATIDPALIERHPGGQHVRVRMIVELDADDAAWLSRIAISRDQNPQTVISSLLRSADRPAT